MIEWEGGTFLGQEDSVCLREAAVQDFTLVTYDRRTITPLLKSWAEEGSRRSGVIFVDEKTISPADLGGLVGALSALMKETGELDWTDRVCFLRRSRPMSVPRPRIRTLRPSSGQAVGHTGTHHYFSASGFAPGRRFLRKAICPQWWASCSQTWNHLQWLLVGPQGKFLSAAMNQASS